MLIDNEQTVQLHNAMRLRELTQVLSIFRAANGDQPRRCLAGLKRALGLLEAVNIASAPRLLVDPPQARA
eukprot:5730604-Alexandrium_andersonii.AAC.1